MVGPQDTIGDKRLTRIHGKDLGSDVLLTIEQKKFIIEYAQMYGLDPYRNHVVLMYGEPYVTIDGYLYRADRSGKSYSIGSGPIPLEERELYDAKQGDFAWRSTVIVGDHERVVIGIGIVTQEEIQTEAKGKPGVKRYPVVAAKPIQQAQKRAEWQALRRAFPIGKEEVEI